jgi:hypothetical protein
MRTVWRYSTATAVSTLSNGVGHTQIAGVVTPDVAAQVLADNAAWLARSGAMGQVADYSRAVLAIDSMNLLRTAATAARYESALDTPTALVVGSSDQFKLIEDYAGLMARRGAVRAPFLSQDEALRWAARQAVAWEYLRGG